MDKISVILLSWKRPKNISIIIKQLVACDLIDEIILWNNNSNNKFIFNSPKVITVQSESNFGTLARYCVAYLAKNQTIFIQDDDLENLGKLK